LTRYGGRGFSMARPRSGLILGINCAYHESAAALVGRDSVVFAAEEERFTRVKHAKKPRVSNPDLLPGMRFEPV
jgi:predicted NodU family carbamoyl transferase